MVNLPVVVDIEIGTRHGTSADISTTPFPSFTEHTFGKILEREDLIDHRQIACTSRFSSDGNDDTLVKTIKMYYSKIR